MAMKIFIKIVCAFGFLLAPTYPLSAYDASPKCFRDLEINFFQAAIVSQALSMHHVEQAAWTPIIHLLQEGSKHVHDKVKLKAKNLKPNPFDPVFIPEVAENLLKEALFEVFSSALLSYNPYQQLRINGNDIKTMFDYITDQQKSRMERCFGNPKSIK